MRDVTVTVTLSDCSVVNYSPFSRDVSIVTLMHPVYIIVFSLDLEMYVVCKKYILQNNTLRSRSSSII